MGAAVTAQGLGHRLRDPGHGAQCEPPSNRKQEAASPVHVAPVLLAAPGVAVMLGGGNPRLGGLGELSPLPVGLMWSCRRCCGLQGRWAPGAGR